MSYCRWSSDNFKCDLYCFEDVNGGWTTHIATHRIIGDVPEPLTEAAIMERRQVIGLPYDGEAFNDPTLEQFRDRLLHLRETGYRFPDDVLETVEDEMKEEN